MVKNALFLIKKCYRLVTFFKKCILIHMKKDTYINILEDLGLSKEQAIVYQTLLEHGFMKAGSIPRYAKIKRSLVYKVLEQLIRLGLVQKHGGDNAVARYSPLSPEKLRTFIETEKEKVQKKEEEFESIYGNLKSQFNLLSGKPSVQYFEGKEDVAKMIEDTIASGEIIYTYADAEAVMKYIPEINDDHVKKRMELGIEKHILLADNKLARQLKKKNIKNPLTKIRIIDKEYIPFEGITEIYENKVSYITISEYGISGILIEDKQINKMHKFVFEALWEKSK